MLTITEVINNIWFFQTESIVPIFVELSLMIIIIYGIQFGLAFIISTILDKEKRIIYGFVFFPITLVGSYFILYFIGPFFNFNFASIGLSEIIKGIVSAWWVFPLIFIIGKLIRLILWLPEKVIQIATKKDFSNQKVNVGAAIRSGIGEEFTDRFLLINTIFLISNSLELSLVLSIIFFSLSHIFVKNEGKWFGPVAINYTLIAGIGYGIIAIKFGLIVSIIAHIFNNIFSNILSMFLGK